MSLLRRTYLWIVVGGALAFALGCSLSSVGVGVASVGDLQTDTVAVEREDADEVRVTVQMGAGELDIDRGADELMTAEFTYNVEAWQPEVSYEVADGQGYLAIRQPNTDQLAIQGTIRNEWSLRFAEGVPLDMRIECGAGDYRVNLAGLQVTALDMTLGAGDAEIDLSNNPEMRRLEFDMGAGNAEIDLTGDIYQDVDVDIQGGVGKTSLRLPSNIGVRVEVTKGIGEVDANGLTRSGGVWVNEAYGESDVTMDIRVRAGVGRVELNVQD